MVPSTSPSHLSTSHAQSNLSLALTELTFALAILQQLDQWQEVRIFTHHRDALAVYASDWSPPDTELPRRRRDVTDARETIERAAMLALEEDDMLWQDEARELREAVEGWVVRVDEDAQG